MHLLLVDDEKDFVKALKEILENNCYTVETAFDGEEALSYALTNNFDCILLDVMMPKLDGYTFLKTIRDKGNKTPVIFLSAKGDIDDKLKGFELGGDDYLPKPFSAKELLARIKAILRRKDQIADTLLKYEDLVLDTSAYTIACNNKKEGLSSKEFQILELFFRKPDKRYNAEEILSEAWSLDSYADVSSVWVYLSNIRKKFENIDSKVRITSVRGIGYKMEIKNV